MPSVDPRAADIIATIGEFEASVDAAEIALGERDWQRIENLLSDQHRLTQALANALDATSAIRPPAFSAEVDRRVDAIKARRDEQLDRLVAFNFLIKQRLSMMSRSRDLLRSHGPEAPQPRILDLRQ